MAKSVYTAVARMPRFTKMIRWTRSWLGGRNRWAVILGLFVAADLGLLVLFNSGLEVLSAARAYVGGEGLYSKSQKEAVSHLRDFAESRSDADYLLYQAAIAVPLGDRDARIEMEKPVPDLAVVYAGLTQGKNDPADLSRMVWLFRTFRHVSYIARAVDIWTVGDADVQLLQGAAERLRNELGGPNPRPETLNRSLTEIAAINSDLAVLEDSFSSTLGTAARWVQSVLLVAEGLGSALVLGAGSLGTWRLMRHLSQSEERFRKQYKGLPLPTYSWLQVGDDFVLLDFNDAAEAIADGQIRNAIGSTASEHYADRPEILAELRACVTEQRTFRRDTNYRFSDTTRERQLAFTYVFVPPRTVMVHTEDVTEARHAEQQREAMAQSEKLRALGQMASGIAHDLNQSLMLVASYSDLARQALMEDSPNMAELDDLLTTTTQAALDGGETVKRLLLFTRAAPKHDSQPVDLSKVVRDAARLTAPRWRDAAQAEGRPINLHIEAEGTPIIQGSPSQLRELMTNLIFNAVDALPMGGAIRLNVLAEDGQGIVEVIDSGVGMSAELQARVFEPFFTTKGEAGTGLGLAMVFGIVEQHGGRIEVRSARGDGTTFRMRFPLMSEPAAETVLEPSPTSPAQVEPFRLLRILAVDDEPMMIKAVVRMLKPSGHLVSVAGSGEEALQKLAEQTFDVVVSDVGMGAGMNGWELADAVKRRWPHVRFLLATGWGAAIDPSEARSKGVEGVLAKPYHPVDLLRALQRTDRAA
jgi:signal transduction histidine kinase